MFSPLGVALQALTACRTLKREKKDVSRLECILGDPGATCRDDAMFLGESLLQELKSPCELTLTEPVIIFFCSVYTLNIAVNIIYISTLPYIPRF